MRKLLIALLLAVGVVGTSHAASQGNAPSNGATVQQRVTPHDGNGLPFNLNSDVGFKVFEDSASASAFQLVDESSSVVTCGLLHQVCTAPVNAASATVDYAIAFDSAPTNASGAYGALGNISGNLLGKAIIPKHPSSATLVTCQTYDAQFNNGLAILNGSANVVSYWYWRPCRGGSN